MNLTVKRVARLLRHGQHGRHRDGDVRGLYLCIGGKRNANWQLRYQLHGKAHWMGLGSAREFSLKEARERAKSERQKLSDKNDPLQLRRADHAAKAATAATVKTFKKCAEAYIEAHQGKWKSVKHGMQWKTSLATFVYPKIGNLDVAAIGRPHVLNVLEQRVEAQLGHPAGQFWQVRTVSADRLRNRIELILNFAAARGYRNNDNPARWEDLKHILPQPAKLNTVKHHAAVAYDEVPTLVAELRKREGVGARALEFLMLTAARTGEVLGALWSEIDFDKKEWTVPAERMKGGREHRVPLSPQCMTLLRGLYREDGNQHVFIGARQPRLSDTTLSELLKRLDRVETIHGFRSSFTDWAHERTASPNIVIDMALAHSVGTAVEKAYRRSDLFDKRRKLMDAWATYCATPPAKASAEVVPMRALTRAPHGKA
jgi:integrase